MEVRVLSVTYRDFLDAVWSDGARVAQATTSCLTALLRPVCRLTAYYNISSATLTVGPEIIRNCSGSSSSSSHRMPLGIEALTRAVTKRAHRGLYAGKRVLTGNNISEDGGNK